MSDCPRAHRSRHIVSCVLAVSIVALLGCGTGGTAAVPLGAIPRVVLTSHIADLAHVALVVPSGALSGDEIKPHSHFRTDGTSVPIYAPVDMTLTQGTWVGSSNDYGLIFEVNARYRILFGHITAPRADIVSIIPMVDPSSRYDDIGPISFAAGEQIGFSSGTAAVNGIDFGLYDLAMEADTPNTPRYLVENFQKLTGVCPYEYFADGLRPSYTALFGTIGGMPVPGGPCRTLADQSAAGAIAGEWTLVSHAPDGTYQTRFALGTHLDGATVRIAGIAGTFDVVGGVDPKTITAEVCYASGGNYVFLRRTGATTLDAVFGAGPCPPSFPAGSHRSYER